MSAIQKHNQWIRQMQDQGWSYGPQWDEAKKKHPRMLPWEKLGEQAQAEFSAEGHHDGAVAASVAAHGGKPKDENAPAAKKPKRARRSNREAK